jgi:hypothetical protein
VAYPVSLVLGILLLCSCSEDAAMSEEQLVGVHDGYATPTELEAIGDIVSGDPDCSLPSGCAQLTVERIYRSSVDPEATCTLVADLLGSIRPAALRIDGASEDFDCYVSIGDEEEPAMVGGVFVMEESNPYIPEEYRLPQLAEGDVVAFVGAGTEV